MKKLSKIIIATTLSLGSFIASAQNGIYYNSQGQVYQPLPPNGYQANQYGNNPQNYPYGLYPPPPPMYYPPPPPVYIQPQPVYIPPPVYHRPPPPPSYGLDGTSLLIGGVTGVIMYNALKPRHNHHYRPRSGFRPHRH